MDDRRARHAQNEMLFRSINERIESLGEAFFEGPDGEGPVATDFVCECHDAGCTDRVTLSTREYEAVRANGRSFVVAPSPEHVDTGIENVVDMSSSRYWIVEKTDESGAAAEATDPRG